MDKQVQDSNKQGNKATRTLGTDILDGSIEPIDRAILASLVSPEERNTLIGDDLPDNSKEWTIKKVKVIVFMHDTKKTIAKKYIMSFNLVKACAWNMSGDEKSERMDFFTVEGKSKARIRPWDDFQQ